ncbi:hypothetical protein TNCV_3240741 [Trichonephila clavipes]|nr:hypothetical protein TNCV_3240741 [Trichonephila clavipes]
MVGSAFVRPQVALFTRAFKKTDDALPHLFERQSLTQEYGAFYTYRAGNYALNSRIGKRNAGDAKRLYRERYPQRNAPDRKIEELTEILNVNKVHIACLQETKLNPNLKLKIKGLTTLRKDRKDRAGGGLVFLVKSADIKFREIILPPTTDYNENSTEVQAMTVLLPQQEVTIINAYHPDNSDINLDLLNTLLDTKSDTKILLGDLNAKSPSWDPGS